MLAEIRRRWALTGFGNPPERMQFIASLHRNFETCDWQPHPEHSVFTQYDSWYYLRDQAGFMRKYRWMYAVAKTIDPRKLIELGTHAGSSADAYLSASRANRGGAANCDYIGIDLFNDQVSDAGDGWRPLEVANTLFQKRRFVNFRFVRADLRSLTELEPAHLVVVDAEHDDASALADMKLAMTAHPEFLFIDDFHGSGVFAAWRVFSRSHRRRIDWVYPIDYPDGGLVVKLKAA